MPLSTNTYSYRLHMLRGTELSHLLLGLIFLSVVFFLKVHLNHCCGQTYNLRKMTIKPLKAFTMLYDSLSAVQAISECIHVD